MSAPDRDMRRELAGLSDDELLDELRDLLDTIDMVDPGNPLSPVRLDTAALAALAAGRITMAEAAAAMKRAAASGHPLNSSAGRTPVRPVEGKHPGGAATSQGAVLLGYQPRARRTARQRRIRLVLRIVWCAAIVATACLAVLGAGVIGLLAVVWAWLQLS